MNALVISGGGSKGAFAGGVAEFLIRECKRDYKLFIGTSTGSLLIPLLALGEVNRIKEIYTSVTQKDVFTICPFIVENKNGQHQTRINHLGIIKMFIRRKKTFGDSSNLRKLIGRSITKSDFSTLKNMDKEVIITVANLTNRQVEYKSSKECEYEDFCDWIWASANMLPFMSLVEKNGMEYGDGGFGNLIPVQEAISRGATCADVIVLRPETRTFQNPAMRNAFNVMWRTYDFMLNQIAKDDLIIGRLEAATKKVNVEYFYTPRVLTEFSFIFDPKQMKTWWEEGYELFKNVKPIKHCVEPASIH